MNCRCDASLRAHRPAACARRLHPSIVKAVTMHAPSRGLYKDAYERDSCGFGLIASLDDEPSHWLVQHRHHLAQPPDPPRRHRRRRQDRGWLRAAAEEAGGVPARGGRGGRHHARPRASPPDWCFCSREPQLAARRARHARAQLERAGLSLAGWRAVPTDPAACGAEALKTLPRIEQLFVNCRGARPRRGRLQPPAVPGAAPHREGARRATRRSTCRACRPAPSSTRAW